jgi:hypothetical protein
MVASFLYSLCGGMLIITATARLQQIAWSFLRLIGFLCFGINCLVVFGSLSYGPGAAGTASEWALRLGIATAVMSFVLVFSASLASSQPGAVRIICLVGGVMGVMASCLTIAARFGGSAGSPFALPLTLVGHVLGALLLGSVTVAWLLGHAYLTATKMTIAPLMHFSRMLLYAVGVRLVFLLVVVGLPLLDVPIAGSPSSSALMGSWILLVMRVGVGLATVGVFAYMVYDCVRIRSTQSATGILYFGSVLVYVGELTSQYLSMQFSWPV